MRNKHEPKVSSTFSRAMQTSGEKIVNGIYEGLVSAVITFPIDHESTRLLISRDLVIDECAKLAYTDNQQDWTEVTLGNAINESVQGLSAFDYRHVWGATDRGNIYFSEDGGESWVLQFTCGTSLSAIRFCDKFHGFAVGLSDEMYSTHDGGRTWNILGGTGSGDDFLCIYMFDPLNVIVGSSNGNVYSTTDGGFTWKQSEPLYVKYLYV